MSQHDDLFTALIPAPFGSVCIALHAHQLHRLTLRGDSIDHPSGALLDPSRLAALPPQNLGLLLEIAQQLQNYFQHAQTTFNLPLAVQGTSFQQRVWQAIARIPLGETRSYSQLAESIGSGARAVANACGANPYPLLIPCHRVVASEGIGGFMQGHPSGLSVKRWLLKHESARSLSLC